MNPVDNLFDIIYIKKKKLIEFNLPRILTEYSQQLFISVHTSLITLELNESAIDIHNKDP